MSIVEIAFTNLVSIFLTIFFVNLAYLLENILFSTRFFLIIFFLFYMQPIITLFEQIYKFSTLLGESFEVNLSKFFPVSFLTFRII